MVSQAWVDLSRDEIRKVCLSGYIGEDSPNHDR